MCNRMRKLSSYVVTALALVTLSACDMNPKSGYGFTLPEGDTAAGEEIFKKFSCSDCHTLEGRDDLREGMLPSMEIPLGGTTTRISTYGELVTSVINPSHKISKRYLDQQVDADGTSLMRNYNDAMTVSELVDLIAFLQAQYNLEPYPRTHY